MASRNPRTGIVRWPRVIVQPTHDFWWTCGQKKNRKAIVHSHGPRTAIARLPLAARAVSVKSQGYCLSLVHISAGNRTILSIALISAHSHKYNRLTIFLCPHVHQKSCVGCTITLGQRTMPVRGLCDAIYDMYTG